MKCNLLDFSTKNSYLYYVKENKLKLFLIICNLKCAITYYMLIVNAKHVLISLKNKNYAKLFHDRENFKLCK